jgi:hypothetical protein
MDLEDLEGEAKFYQILSKYEWETFIETLYKRKDRKILLVNTSLKGGINPGGGINYVILCVVTPIPTTARDFSALVLHLKTSTGSLTLFLLSSEPRW